ncbi:hypothetical protein FZC74_12910 [Sutcliffiella horikoshii]|uniref:Uncharacterized protein n=1 Tax=Sutcliffiella horikoshii TaxID=79883 RepID=A0AA94WMP1_9BACI|nr:hypothetical protein FZC74_12910 [Sutcliffiella horikoshii]
MVRTFSSHISGVFGQLSPTFGHPKISFGHLTSIFGQIRGNFGQNSKIFGHLDFQNKSREPQIPKTLSTSIFIN